MDRFDYFKQYRGGEREIHRRVRARTIARNVDLSARLFGVTLAQINRGHGLFSKVNRFEIPAG